jgi:hypothetical protein
MCHVVSVNIVNNVFSVLASVLVLYEIYPTHLLMAAVPWLRSLVAGLSLRRSGFAHGSIHVGFVVDKAGTGTVSSPGTSVFPCQCIILPSLSKFISSGEWVIC